MLIHLGDVDGKIVLKLLRKCRIDWIGSTGVLL
jgi:hypothetical protein